jgi:cytochrome c oxidase subunit 2
LLLLALARARGRRSEADPRPGADAPRLTSWIVGGGALIPALVVAALLLSTLRSLNAVTPVARAPLRAQVVGHQWWWEIRYPEHGVVTANELHVPVGQAVEVELLSPDVIHSFWVPALHGKRDLIPGRSNSLRLEASRAGVYRGQCAEYCGWQHARMAFLVVADSPERFRAWLAAQRAPAPEPDEPLRERGRDLFLGFCAACHTVRGTSAAGRFGPDLTHLGGRRTLGAVLLPNTAENLAAWIVDAQAFKPGNKMPRMPLEPGVVAALVAYLGGLR